MPARLTRRAFAALGPAAAAAPLLAADDPPANLAPMPAAVPTQAPRDADYPAPPFNPSFRRPQVNHRLVQDFVIYAHLDLDMVKRLLEKEPALLHAHMDWGGGDWESALGAAAHMGKRDTAEYLLGKGARIDIFCAAMLGQLAIVKGFLTAYPALIDAKGPHGINLHTHAKMGGKDAAEVLAYLQSVKAYEFPPPRKKG